MTPSFNLIEEPWIPCILPDGTIESRGILRTLSDAHNIREIYDNSPLVTVSLHRLLLAILYSTKDFREQEDWEDWWEETWLHGQFSRDDITRYLEDWRPRFDLFDEEHPFYQVAGLRTEKPTPALRLATEMQSDWFNHPPPAEEYFQPAEAARLLVASQSFALGFGKSSDAIVNGTRMRRPYSADAPVLRGVTAWLAGTNLFQTLMLNLVPCDIPLDDRPAWEHDSALELMDEMVGSRRVVKPFRGVVDRYTAQSRLVQLIPEPCANGVGIRDVYFVQGRSETKESSALSDPMKAYQRGDSGYYPLALNDSKAAWRDAQSLLSVHADVSKPPEVVRFVAMHIKGAFGSSLVDCSAIYRMHVVGIATARNKAGKFLLWRHDRMPVPASLLANETAIERLGRLVGEAEQTAEELHKRWKKACQLYLAPECYDPVTGGFEKDNAPNPDDVGRLVREMDPRTNYWARLERHFHELLEDVSKDIDSASDRWRADVAREARHAYRESCDTLGTSALAVQAVARVSDYFGAGHSGRAPSETPTKEVSE